MKNIPLLSNATIALGLIAIVCLLILHFVSSEFKPHFRMVSEYALGKHKWLLTLMFICWGACTILAGLMLWDVVTSGWARLGVVLMCISGIGAIMGGLFDVQHKLHGLSFAIGVPFLPVAALLIAYHLIGKPYWNGHAGALLFSAHAVWVSVVFMGIGMFVLFSTLKATGVEYGPNAPAFSELPKGVIGFNGWANRLLVICYIAFPVMIAKLLVALHALKS